jgi:hypothetical protein
MSTFTRIAVHITREPTEIPITFRFPWQELRH